MYVQREYAVSDTIYFPLIDATTGDFFTGTAPVAGDVRVSKDGGTNSNATNFPTIIPTSSGIWKIVLTATELTAKVISLWIVDATATKLWKDQCIIIDTYGNASAQHLLNLNEAMRGTDNAALATDLATAQLDLDDLTVLITKGTVSDATPTIGNFDTSLTEVTDAHFAGAVIQFTSGVLIGQARKINVYTGATKNIATVAGDEFTDVPANGDAFQILGRIG